MKAMSAIERCRTAALGGHVARCENDACGHTTIAYNSCRNRHCPKCQGRTARERGELATTSPPISSSLWWVSTEMAWCFQPGPTCDVLSAPTRLLPPERSDRPQVDTPVLSIRGTPNMSIKHIFIGCAAVLLTKRQNADCACCGAISCMLLGWVISAALRTDRIDVTGRRKLTSCVRRWLCLSGLAKISKRPPNERVLKSLEAAEKSVACLRRGPSGSGCREPREFVRNR